MGCRLLILILLCFAFLSPFTPISQIFHQGSQHPLNFPLLVCMSLCQFVIFHHISFLSKWAVMGMVWLVVLCFAFHWLALLWLVCGFPHANPFFLLTFYDQLMTCGYSSHATSYSLVTLVLALRAGNSIKSRRSGLSLALSLARSFPCDVIDD